jgi:hypothetical protein
MMRATTGWFLASGKGCWIHNPILSNDPSSHPPDKLKILETANEWHAAYG